MRKVVPGIGLLSAMLVLHGVMSVFAQAPSPPKAGDEVELIVSPLKPDVVPESFAKFSHVTHTARRLKTKCTDCHRLGVDGNRFRPSPDETCTPCHIGDGKIDAYHASWNQRIAEQRRLDKDKDKVEPIHRTHIFYDCIRCHGEMVHSEAIGDIPLPPTENTAESCVECHSRAVRFSHKAHIRVDGKFKADCATCHQPRCDGTEYSIPGHPQCWTCHDITLLALTDGCNLCHLEDARRKKEYNLERAAVLHREHPRAKVPCDKCHTGILTAETLEEVRAARQSSATVSCESCHALPK